MQKYINSVANQSGAPVPGASILVQNYPSLTTATIYGSNSTANPITNPTTTDNNGNFGFYAADGRYQITITGTNIQTVVITDILLEDPVDGGSPGNFTSITTTSTISPSYSGDQFIISNDASPYREGSAGLITSGTLFTLAGSVPLMKYRSHNVAIALTSSGTVGTIGVTSDTGPAQLETFDENGIEKIWNAPTTTGGQIPTFGSNPVYTLDWNTGNWGVSGTIGFITGAGGTVAQVTSKSNGVALNAKCGAITMNSASLGATTSVSFTLTNTVIGANDVVVANIRSGATAGAYTLTVDAVGSTSCQFSLRNVTASPLSEAVVIGFAVIKGVVA